MKLLYPQAGEVEEATPALEIKPEATIQPKTIQIGKYSLKIDLFGRKVDIHRLR